MNIILIILYNQTIDSVIIICGVYSLQVGDTALHLAAYFGHTETVDQLVSVGADVNISNKVS